VHILGFDSPGMFFSKRQYEKNPDLVAKYVEAVAEMQQVLKTSKPLFEAPIQKSAESDRARGERVVNFEKLIVSVLPDPNIGHNVSVSALVTLIARLRMRSTPGILSSLEIFIT
jgi:hypothetical protein